MTKAPDVEGDGRLVIDAQRGDRDALDTLLRRHHDRIFAVCRRLAGNEADAPVATQEALLAIIRGLPRFDGRAAFGTWAYRVATNACLDELRRRGRGPVPTEVVPGSSPDGRSASHGASSTGDRVGDAVTTRLDVDAALACLSPDHRAAVVLRDLAGLSYDEIAEALDLAPGTVRSRLARGRAAVAAPLRVHLGDAGGPGPGTSHDDRGNHDPADRRPTPRP